jgi:hypothetical protein
MPEIQTVSFDLRELAEILVKRQDLHEGLWGIYVEFGFGATNIGATPIGPTPNSSNPAEANILPASITMIRKIGIQRFPEPNNLTVDAAVVNPKAGTRAASAHRASEK